MAFKCFWLEPVGRAEIYLSVDCAECKTRADFVVQKVTYDAAAERRPKIDSRWSERTWPATCRNCGHVFDFDGADWRHMGTNYAYRRTDTGEEGLIRDFGVGAMWDAMWYDRKGPDGRSLVVRLPGDHDWMVDSRASNCDQRDREHYCWVRTGEVPNVTANKGQPGESCSAGGGSIWVDMPHGWHGFLTRGWLHEPAEQAPA